MISPSDEDFAGMEALVEAYGMTPVVQA